MLSHADNEMLTRTGPGTPTGQFMRAHRFPSPLSEELVRDAAPKKIALLGEKLVAFRDSEGRVGLVAELCPHRRASLYYGRNEEGGLRCVYHGWKFDVEGRCVDMPSQPLGCPLQAKVRLAAWRMHLADEMLRVGRSSVAQVAERLGYQTGYAFRRVFRRVRGVGPGDVRRRARLGTVSSAAAEDER